MRERAIRILDSYASLLVLLLGHFFLLEVVHDERWAVIGSTLLGAAALVVAISDPDTGHTVGTRPGNPLGGWLAAGPLRTRRGPARRPHVRAPPVDLDRGLRAARSRRTRRQLPGSGRPHVPAAGRPARD